MRCPHCAIDLKIADRQGIEIDYCPNCRGVWLDRGELDKILDRTAAIMPVTGTHGGFSTPPNTGYGAPQQQRSAWRHDDDDDDDDDRRRHYGQQGYGQPDYRHPGLPQQGYRRKRESWLGDLFDFD